MSGPAFWSRRDVDNWERHWNDFSDAAGQNPAQRYRRRTIFQALDRLGPPERLIDIGSGQGDLLAATRERWPSAELAGLELSAEGVDVARAKVPSARLLQWNLLVDGAAPAGLDRWATHAVCSEVLEHVDDPVQLLSNAIPFLAPACVVVVTVPGGPMSAFDRYIGHRRHFSVDVLRAVLREAGLTVDRVDQAGFPAFNLYKLLVIARGDRLISDVSSVTSEGRSRLASAAMRAFRPLFACSLARSPWGWQLLATARV
jgi:SAM-dependent methyltransferase